MFPSRTGTASASLLVAAAMFAGAGPLLGQDPLEHPDPSTSESTKDWSLALTPYAFFAAQSTDVGGQALRQSFNDLASITNAGFQTRLLARWRWLTLTVDGTFARLGNDQQIGPVRADLEVKQVILDMKLGGRVYDSRTPDEDGGLAIWAGLGARYWDNQVEVVTERESLVPGRPPVVDTIQAPQTWWDPVVGVAFHFPVTRVVSFAVRGTGGGLGIGEASDYLWDAEFSALFRLGRRFLLSAGYRQFKYSREDGEGEEAVRQTVSVVGPQVGLSIGIF